MAEKDRGRMREEDYFLVQRFHTEIIREIDPRFIIDQLFSSFLFDERDLEQVRAEQERNGRTEGAKKIMEILRHSGADAFSKFLVCLRRAGYVGLVTLLENGQKVQRGMAVQEENKLTE
ncbi:hypothetical protein SNE40_015752 [Patella caerulea]|uniref:CARD domain-containing protein n=1 Tax=Patella caerulea TaxID=87958 RepID=A0AAN8PFE8_PATCE